MICGMDSNGINWCCCVNQVTSIAEGLAAAGNADVETEAKRRAEKLAEFEAVTPRRRSSRPSAQLTRELLSKQAKGLDTSEDEEDASQQSGSDADDGEPSASRKRSRESQEEEEDYDPLEELSGDSAGHETEAGEEEDAGPEREEEDEEEAHVMTAPVAAQAGPSNPGAVQAPPAWAGHDSEEDEELQQALAMSLMEQQPPPDQAQGKPGASGQAAGPSQLPAAAPAVNAASGAGRQRPAAAAPAQKGKGKRAQKAAAAGDAAAQGQSGKEAAAKKGKGRSKKRAPLEASEADLQKAFAMLAGSRSAINAHGIEQV